MIRRIARAAAGLLAAAALVATVGSTQASATPGTPGTPGTGTGTATESWASVSLTYRGSYWTYHDCDVAGFTGVYYGWWTGYICQWRNGANVWDLYAG